MEPVRVVVSSWNDCDGELDRGKPDRTFTTCTITSGAVLDNASLCCICLLLTPIHVCDALRNECVVELMIRAA